MFRIRTLTLVSLFLLSAMASQAQEFLSPALLRIATAESTPRLIRLRESLNLDPKTLFRDYPEAFGLRPGVDQMMLVSSKTDKQGISHHRFQLYYKQLPVDGSEMIVHARPGGAAVAITGKKESGISLNTDPVLTPAAAVRSAISLSGSRKLLSEDPAQEQRLRNRTHKTDTSYYPVARLMIYNFGGQRYLAYRVDVYSLNPHRQVRLVIDALSGAKVNEIPLESNCDTAGFATIFNSNRTIRTSMDGSNYVPNNNCIPDSIHIMDWNSTTGNPNPVEVTSANNTWTTNNQRFAGSVLWATEEARKYYLNVHGRNSYDDQDGALEGYINAIFTSANGTTYPDNASMSFYGGFMKVGLGSSGTLANSFCAVDIICHEYTHAVTGSTAELNYQGESGALNESFSDIFGEMGERYVNGTNNWLIGSDRTSGAFRNMQNPNQFNHPDTYRGSYWYTGTADYGGVHTNSGVQNHWFELLVDGGSGTNDIRDVYSVTGIGFLKASAIAYSNLANYLTSYSDYQDARDGSVLAAELMYGQNSPEVCAVSNAWFAVGISGSISGAGTCGTVSGPSSIVPGGTATYSISCNSATTYTWVVPSGWTITSGQGTNTIQVTVGNSSGNVRIKTKIGCGTFAQQDKAVTVTNCPQPTVSFTGSPLSGGCPLSVNFQDNSTLTGNASWSWKIYNSNTPPLYTTSTQQNPSGIVFNQQGNFAVELTVTDNCGTKVLKIDSMVKVSCANGVADAIALSDQLQVYPNPASEVLHIAAPMLRSGDCRYELSNQIGQPVRSGSWAIHGGLKAELPIAGLSSGLYLLRVFHADETAMVKVVKR